MSLSIALIVLLTATLSLFLAWHNRRRNALIAKLPGPPVFLPLIGNLLEVVIRILWMGGDVFELSAETVQRYGTVFKIWAGHIPYVLISNPDDTEAVLTNPGPAVADKGKNYELIGPWLGDGLLLAGGKKWHARRKTIAPAFGVRILDQFVDVFNKHAAILEAKLKRHADRPPFDVVPFVTLCTLDVICETAMGVQIHAQTKDDSEYAKAVKTSCRCFFKRLVYPWLGSDALLRLSSLGKEFYGAIQVLHGMTLRVIRQRRKEITLENLDEAEDDVGMKQRLVLLDHLLTKSLHGEDITDQDITDEVNTFLFAGHDTTMTALCFTLHLLSKHPDVQEAVFREVQDVVGDGDVSAHHLNELKYLECVVKESLRLYPSVPIIVRACKQEFQLPSGYTIPVGAQVGINILNLHRNPAVFPEPDKFDPDRFLGDAVQGRHHFGYVPFSAAQRNCIGQRFAMMEVKTILAHLVRSFRILPPKEDYRLKIKIEIVLGAEGGILVQLQNRISN